MRRALLCISPKQVSDNLVYKTVPLQHTRAINKLAGLPAGSAIRGQFDEENFKRLLKDIGDKGGNVICFIDEPRKPFRALTLCDG